MCDRGFAFAFPGLLWGLNVKSDKVVLFPFVFIIVKQRIEILNVIIVDGVAQVIRLVFAFLYWVVALSREGLFLCVPVGEKKKEENILVGLLDQWFSKWAVAPPGGRFHEK